MVPPTSCMSAALLLPGMATLDSSPLLPNKPLHYSKLHHPDNPTGFLSPLRVYPADEGGLWGCGQWPGSTQPPTGGMTAQTSRPWNSACGPTITAWQARLKAPQGVARGVRLLLSELLPAWGLQASMLQLPPHPRTSSLAEVSSAPLPKAGGLR